MSVRSQTALTALALAFSSTTALAQNMDDGKDPFKEDRVAKARVSASTRGGGKWEGHPRGLEMQNSMYGATGLLRTISADSGGVGTFRMSLLGSYYTGSGFLCPTCELPNGTLLQGKDDVSQIGTRVGISATPVSFLEAYASLRYQGTSNDKGQPKVIETVGDMTLGVKGFMPTRADRIFSFGGSADMLLINSAGSLGLDAASVALRGLATADLTRQPEESRLPLRFHANIGYLFDNSGVLADRVERDRAKVFPGTRPRITRVERFGHDINRVDTFRTALAVEGAFPWVRPFLEWTLDVGVNRQGYECGNTTNRTVGDGCLKNAGFSEMPSRLTIGARAFPWLTSWMDGLALLAAVDVGTGATTRTIEEVAPQLPWTIHIGAAWAADTEHKAEAEVVEKIVEVEAPRPTEHFIEGTVVRAGKGEPVADAIVRYAGRALTGMVTNEQGQFRTMALDPGEYRFTVTAPDYRDGECVATIAGEEKPAKGAAPKSAADAQASPGAKDAAPPKDAPANAPGKGDAPGKAPATPPAQAPEPTTVTRVTCEIEALPRTATITGTLRDADTTEFVGGATVTITDPLGRNLALRTDAEGTFRFGNVPAGKSSLMAEADGYLRAQTDVTLEPRKDVSTDIVVHKRPAVPNVIVTAKEIKLRKEVHFLHGSAEILPDSMSLLEEVADVIRAHAEIPTIEVQGHTDDTGSPEINLKLSTARANAVRDVLTEHGVEPGRLTAQGYGQDKPLVPNTSPRNRAKNRRVQLVIVK